MTCGFWNWLRTVQEEQLRRQPEIHLVDTFGIFQRCSLDCLSSTTEVGQRCKNTYEHLWKIPKVSTKCISGSLHNCSVSIVRNQLQKPNVIQWRLYTKRILMPKPDIDKADENGWLRHTVFLFACQIELELEQVQLQNIHCFHHPDEIFSKGNFAKSAQPRKIRQRLVSSL